jgi:vacuolar-type H+-ATPase subunit I/STV1
MLQYNFSPELSEDETLASTSSEKNTPERYGKENAGRDQARSKNMSKPRHNPDNLPPANRRVETVKRNQPPASAIVKPIERPDSEQPTSRDGQVMKFLTELSRLEELLLRSPRVPLTGKAMVAEDDIIEQLDFIRSRMPAALEAAQSIINQRDLILQAAEQHAQQQVAVAQQQAFQISNELGIIDRAKIEAAQIRQAALNDVENSRDQINRDIEQTRHQYQQEMDAIRQQAVIEAQEIRRGADEYADRVLLSIDSQISDIQTTIRRGRQHLNPQA